MAKKNACKKCQRLIKFYVAFYHSDDEELDVLLETNPDAEDEYVGAHTYHNEIALNCSEEEYYACLDNHADEINCIETTYGVLDGEGFGDDAGWEMGYSSYEISLEDAPVVWEKLVAMLREAGLLAE